ncbi:MAG: hypothetical protein HYZ10_08695 [Ignavibacteriales bacterium]|nr:hypothetical protein [Ignavibacteriales bacterium]
MENLYYIIFGFASLVIIRFLLNISKYFYLSTVLAKQDIFVEGRFQDSNEKQKKASQKAGNWVQANQIEIKNVVLKTGIQDQRTSYMEPLGFGYTQKESVTALDNLLMLNPEVMGSSKEIIKRAKGYYKIQALKCFNPLFWIEFIVFLPKELLKYFGVDDNAKGGSVMIKIFQVIYWLVSIFFMYQTYLKNYK